MTSITTLLRHTVRPDHCVVCARAPPPPPPLRIGILGQTFDRDEKKVVGALDDYNVPSATIVTRANAEGAIEGTAVDYEIDPKDPHSTKFKYSRFGLTDQRVSPRNVSQLSGIKLPAKFGASAGAVNDEPEA